MLANKCVRSVTPMSPNDFQCIPNVSPCRTCPFAATCNPLQIEHMRRKVSDAIQYLDRWNDGAYVVTVDSDDFSVSGHRYDLRAVIAGLSVILHEALGLPLGDLPCWEDQYPVVLPVDATQAKSQKGCD